MDIFQGDPKLILTKNGSDMVFRGGQPVLDQGVENQVNISLFTRPGWAGNALFSNPQQQIGSDFEETNEGPITLTKLADIEDSARRALQSDIFGNIIPTTTNPVGQRLNTVIRIEPPGRDILQLLVEKNGLNWVAQKINPAHERI